MIKKYKIACCVLGAIVLVLILALAITVFVFAGNIKAADGVENASGDIADTISEAVFLTTSYVGMVIFVFAIIVGCLLLLYLIAYAAFYAQIYSKGKCRVDFIAYGAVAFGIATAFIVVMTVIFPKTYYGVLITVSLTFAVMVAYAVVEKKYTSLVTASENFWATDNESIGR